MTSIIQDIRYGARLLLKQPRFTVVAVITLALGIGVNTAIFSVVHGVLLRPLPFKDSERVALVWHHGAEAAGGDRTPLSYADLLDWRAQNKSFESIAALQWAQLNMSADNPIQLRAVNVTANFLSTLGVGVQLGRDFQASDEQVGAPRVAVINETFRRRFFGAEDPLRSRINTGSPSEPTWLQIVGVVGDVKYNGVTEDVQPLIYQSLDQQPTGGGFLLVKSDVEDPLSLVGSIRNEVKKLDSDLPLTNVATMDQRLSNAVSQPRFRTTLIGSFAIVALILACVGIYGVISYSVAQRTHEIGIRMALGARGVDVLRMIVRQAILMAGVGVVLGLSISFALGSLMVELLFGVAPRDPVTFIATAILPAGTAVLASYIPARRASKVDPLIALRSD